MTPQYRKYCFLPSLGAPGRWQDADCGRPAPRQGRSTSQTGTPNDPKEAGHNQGGDTTLHVPARSLREVYPQGHQLPCQRPEQECLVCMVLAVRWRP